MGSLHAPVGSIYLLLESGRKRHAQLGGFGIDESARVRASFAGLVQVEVLCSTILAVPFERIKRQGATEDYVYSVVFLFR